MYTTHFHFYFWKFWSSPLTGGKLGTSNKKYISPCLRHSRCHRSERRTGETCDGEFFLLQLNVLCILFVYYLPSIAQEPQAEQEEVENNNRKEEKSEQQTDDNGEETDTLTLHYFTFKYYCAWIARRDTLWQSLFLVFFNAFLSGSPETPKDQVKKKPDVC